MRLDVLKQILEEEIGVDPNNRNPFAPRVSIQIGSQAVTPTEASKLALCQRGVLVFTPQGTARFAATLSGKKIKLVMVLRKVSDYMYSKKHNDHRWLTLFGNVWLGFFNCSEEQVQNILIRLSSHGMMYLYINDYILCDTSIDRYSNRRRGKLVFEP